MWRGLFEIALISNDMIGINRVSVSITGLAKSKIMLSGRTFSKQVNADRPLTLGARNWIGLDSGYTSCRLASRRKNGQLI